MARPVQLVRHSHTRLMWRSCSCFPTLDVPDQALLHGDQHALSHRLSGDMFFYLRHLGTSIFFGFFGHRPFILYVDTCCVWGGFGRFQTYLGATTRCLLFAGTGGVFTQWANPPPCSLCFVFFCFVFLSRSPTFIPDQGTVHNCFLGPSRLRGTFHCGDRVDLRSFLRG